MLTRALAVAGVVALTATMGPGVASSAAGDAAQTSSLARVSDGDDLRPRWVRDRSRDHRWPDHNARGLWVWPSYRDGWLIVQVEGQTLRPSRTFNGVELHLQTRGDRRPDYRVVYNLSGDGDGLSGAYVKRIRGWDSPGRIVSCPRLSAEWRPRTDAVEINIPRPCIRRQGRVKVNARAWNYTRYGSGGGPTRGVADTIPTSRGFSTWI